MFNFRLGKKPAAPGAIKLKLVDYLDNTSLPKLPEGDFGHAALFPASGWGTLGNDTVGDCVIAGSMHETMLWNRLAGHDVKFSTADALDDYTAVTGFDPSKTDAEGNNPTDQGTDMSTAANYRQKIGIRDIHDVRHKIAAYAEIALDPQSLFEAAYLFDAIGVGLVIPEIALEQFDQGKPWDATDNDGDTLGGHYVPAIGRRNGNLLVVTYGRLQEMTPAFLTKYCDEAVAYISTEMMTGGKSIEGFDVASLQKDLAVLTAKH